MYSQDSIDFLRDFSEVLLKYGLSLEQIKSGRVRLGEDEIMLDTLKWDSLGFSGKVVADFTGLFSQRLPTPQPVYLFAGEKEKHRCVYCGSSRYRNFWGIRTQRCINPQCHNYHKPAGFEVIPTAQVASNTGL